MTPATSSETTTGIVIFIDLDNYMAFASGLKPSEEWELLLPLHDLIQTISRQFGFIVARTFGDGFLLYRESHVDNQALSTAGSMLTTLRNSFDTNRMTFKAVVAGGGFVRAVSHNDKKVSETILCGGVVNFAGKKLKELARQKILCSWPEDNTNLQSETFDNLTSQESRRKLVVCDAAEVHDLCRMAASVPAKTPVGRPTNEKLTFSTTVKEFTLEMIKLADDKAKHAFAVAIGFLAYLFNREGLSFLAHNQIPRTPISKISDLILLVVYVSLICSAFFAATVLIPRTKTSHRGLLFFGSISKFPNADRYAEAVSSQDLASLQQETAKHNYDISRVSEAKFIALRRCLILTFIGLSFGLAWLLLEATTVDQKRVTNQGAQSIDQSPAVNNP